MALAVASVTPSTIASGTDHLVDLPATVDAGNVLHIEIMWPSSATVVSSEDFDELYNYVVGSLRLMAFHKVADGTEDGTTVNIVSSSAVVALAGCTRITGYTATLGDVTLGGGATGNTDADPPNVSGPVNEEALYITAAALNNNEDVSAFPSGYTAGIDLVGANHSLHSAYLIETSSSDNPGIFNYIDADAGDTWQAETVRYPTSGTAAVLEQEGFRWREDDGDESGASWREAQDTDTSIPLESDYSGWSAGGDWSGGGDWEAPVTEPTRLRLRILINADGDPPTGTATLQYKRSDEDDTAWKTIT